MTLSTRAIAMQGLGFSPALVAMQGLRPIGVEPSRFPLLGATGGGASVSLSEWRRRYGPAVQVPAAEPAAARRKKRTRRQRDEEMLLLLH